MDFILEIDARQILHIGQSNEITFIAVLVLFFYFLLEKNTSAQVIIVQSIIMIPGGA